MIVTSMRCYLNILTQMMTKEQLLTAQYYICDKTGIVIPTDNWGWDPETEQYIKRESNDVSPQDRASEYCIGYATSASTMAITEFLTTHSIDIDHLSKSKDPIERYKAYIGTEAFRLSLYNNMLRNIRKDKLYIMIFTDDVTVRYCGDIVCQMLSQVFGQDVTFIDPQYRPYVRGRLSYPGNKEYGLKYIENLIKRGQIFGYIAALSNMQYVGCESSDVGQITAYLSAFETVEEMIDFHNSLFPDEGLPPGQYTRADVEEIIIQKTLRDMSLPRTRMSNMGIIEQTNMFGR